MSETWNETRRLNELKEAGREAALSIRLPMKVYRHLLEKARKAGMESSAFIEKLLVERLENG